VTGSNVVSVAEHVVMTILAAVRNFIPGESHGVMGYNSIALQFSI
jgi:lactate dehydrogenase-like 2-hydroxyacid dehydrogenase